jgi:hypothetical protein
MRPVITGHRFDPRPQHERFLVEKFLSDYLGSPLLVSIHLCFVFIFIVMLHLSEGQAGETWETKKRNALSETGDRWVEMYFRKM